MAAVRAAGPILPALVAPELALPDPLSAARGGAALGWTRVALGLALGLALCAGSPPGAVAEPLPDLAGPLRQLAPSGLLGDVVGSFVLVSSGDDLRSEPGRLEIALPDGSLHAESLDPPLLHGVHRVDAASGRPLRADAPDGAGCPTGAEPDCWQPGDPLPGSNDTVLAWCLASLDDPLGHCPITSPPYPFWSGDAPSAEWFATGFSRNALATVPAREPSQLEPDVRWPFGSDPSFQNELAAFSWNLQELLVTFSNGPSGGTGADLFDAGDPFSIAPGKCSFAQPQYCSAVQAFYDLTGGYYTTLLPDDPSGPPLNRFVWEAGADYGIVEADGVLAPFAGGVAHVLGVERSRSAAGELGVPIVLVVPGATAAGVVERTTEAGSLPGAPAASDAAAPAEAPCTPDPVVPEACDAPLVSAHGVALVYATAPEPGPGALAAAALLALGRLATSRARRCAASPPLTPPGPVW
jgi:hypothetical protein